MPNRTILFADDSATMRTIVEKTFAKEPFDVTVVPSGEAAIMKARELSPDVIIADAGMAGVSGYDVCKAIRDDKSLSGTPVIVMAGVSNPYDESKGAEVGVSEYVKKPFDTSQLIAKVGELADQAASAAPAAPEPAEEPEAERELTKKPSVAPPGPAPIASPIASKPTTKETMGFGERAKPPKPPVPRPTPSATPLEFEPKQQEPEEVIPEEPDVEPIELNQEAQPQEIQVGTLAEMAQVDENGKHLAPEVADEPFEEEAAEVAEAADSEPPPAIVSSTLADAIEKRAQLAPEEIEKKVDGLTADQVEAISALTKEVVERVVWEVVPELAEAMIKEELARLLEE